MVQDGLVFRRSRAAALVTWGASLVACQSPQGAPPREQSAAGSAPVSPGQPALSDAPASAPKEQAAGGPSAATPSASATGGPSEARTYNFDGDPANSPPPMFAFGRTGSGADGRWVVVADPSAPSKPNALAQLDADATNFRFPIAAANEPELRDLSVSVQCKMLSGKVDQACGLVFRYKDDKNYYITRANALEGNIRLYFVKDGRRQQIATHRGEVTANTWHAYRVDARGERLEVYWDGAKVLEQTDATFAEPGKVGVWTKADSVTHFDNLTVAPL